MQVKTIVKRIQKYRGLVYGDVRLEEQLDGLALTVELYPQARNRPQYDRLAPRRFEFVPLWGLRVFFWYMIRRVVTS
jgi:transposase